MHRLSWLCLVLVSPAAFAQSPDIAAILREKSLAESAKQVETFFTANPKNDQARFGLGAIQFIRSIERFGQSLYEYGPRGDRGLLGSVPFLRIPLPENDSPKRISYEAGRQIVKTLHDDLTTCEATLASIQNETVKLTLPIGAIRLDLKGDGQSGTRFATIMQRYMGRAIIPENFEVDFDRGDVAWLRGYCHLLLAFCDIILAHDGKELFESTAHVVFPKIETPHNFIKTLDAPKGNFDFSSVVDLIAVVHLIRLPVKEPAKMKSALAHLEKTLDLSDEMWKFILAETDNEREWIPNPKQKSAIGVPVTQEMVDSWKAFVAEAREILAGKKLIPFWRGTEFRGVNLRKVFTDPRPFDLVLWIQGTATTAYLEEGPMTKKETWDRLQRVFGGEFFGMAFWFN